jgi:hypothetical protein
VSIDNEACQAQARTREDNCRINRTCFDEREANTFVQVEARPEKADRGFLLLAVTEI